MGAIRNNGERLLAEDLFVYLIYLWQSGEILRRCLPSPWLGWCFKERRRFRSFPPSKSAPLGCFNPVRLLILFSAYSQRLCMSAKIHITRWQNLTISFSLLAYTNVSCRLLGISRHHHRRRRQQQQHRNFKAINAQTHERDRVSLTDSRFFNFLRSFPPPTLRHWMESPEENGSRWRQKQHVKT